MRALGSEAVGRVLRAAVREHDWGAPLADLGDELAGADLGPLVQAAAFHGVAPHTWLSLRGLDALDHDGLGALARLHQSGLARHLQALADLRAVSARLSGTGVSWLTFKGPVVAERLYPRPDLRPYGDLDLLVPRGDFARALAALEGEGFRLLDRNWDLILAEDRGQLHLVRGEGTVLDVHWHFLNRSGVRATFAVPVDEVVARARTVSLAGLDVPALDATDSLLHLCLHAALAGGQRLAWLKDVERAVAADPPEWDALVARARAWKARIPVAVVLERARRTLDAAVPGEAVRALAPASVLRIGRAVDRLSPPERATGPATVGASFTWSLRDSVAQTAAALAHRARSRARLRAARRPPDGPDGDATGLALLQPSGDERSRAVFLERLSGPPDQEGS